MLRPAYHTLLDATGGFVPFGEITYMDTVLRWYENENDLRLQRFSFLDISSFPARNELFSPFSFKVNLGVESYAHPTKDKEGYVFYAGADGGLSWHPAESTAVYFMVDTRVKAGGYLPHNTMIGSGKMIFENKDKSLEELITAVCSKGGTTIEAINVFKSSDFSNVIDCAVNACVKRAGELESLL